MYAPDWFAKSPKFVCVYVACTNLFTFLHDEELRYPQQLYPLVISNPALYLPCENPATPDAPSPLSSQYAVPDVPPDLKTAPRLEAVCVGSVTNG